MRQYSAFLLLFFLNFLPPIHSKSVIEPCSSSDSCTSYLSYRVPFDSRLTEISYIFQINVSDILASNAMERDLLFPSSSWDQIIFPRDSLLKLPISCPCIDGIRRSFSTLYTVRPADSEASISESYGGLVSADQIMAVNSINAMHPLTTGESIVIPLPCACFDNRNYGEPAVYVSYVVRVGEELKGVAERYGTTVENLESVNGLGQPQIEPGDILAIPLPACSSENLNWYNESLIVPNGSEAMTANNCIKCKCGPTSLNLQCSVSGLLASCPHVQCKGSNISIGDTEQIQTSSGCNVTGCVYRGHSGRKIFSSIVNSTQVQCSGNHPINPYSTLCPASSPSQPPYSAFNEPIIATNSPANREVAYVSGANRSLTRKAAYFYSLLWEIRLVFILFLYS